MGYLYFQKGTGIQNENKYFKIYFIMDGWMRKELFDRILPLKNNGTASLRFS